MFKVVFVCTGNRFRSPLAEHLLRRHVEGLPVEVSSVGTQEIAEGAALPEAVELGRELGVDLSTHRSRLVHPDVLADADLVLGFEKRHVARAVVDGAADRGRTFTAGELCALLDVSGPVNGDDPVERARTAVAEADRVRRRLRHAPPPAELSDPFGGSAAVYEVSANAVRELVERLARGLFDR